ncbi:uncharacterized protein LOC123879264 isoform X2 [Maniola jurtina]|uniref:uncharacterized protein LOC123879264 isoform X2 n=1 Tax=Maniola jurtina TaxID=191418 RepID=UPI001E68E47E|nr:uncharacterized protein LOC123879264 isoform X2 [Maniola jurtina]
MDNLQVIVIVALAILWINISNAQPVKETYQQHINFDHGLKRKDGNGEVAVAKRKDHLDDNVITDDITLGQKAIPSLSGHDTGEERTSNIIGRRRVDMTCVQINTLSAKKKKLLSTFSNSEILLALHERLKNPLKRKGGRKPRPRPGTGPRPIPDPPIQANYEIGFQTYVTNTMSPDTDNGSDNVERL